MRGKKIPRWEMRGKFIGVRGKKWVSKNLNNSDKSLINSFDINNTNKRIINDDSSGFSKSIV